MYVHFRLVDSIMKPWGKGDGVISSPSTRGGMTISVDRQEKTIGVSICSEKDGFSKKIGRRIADNRKSARRRPVWLGAYSVYAPRGTSNEHLDIIADTLRIER